MRQMEADLGTRLDWIAVDHHNTGHPHTHIIVRGVTDDGKILNIAGDYIAHGIRERASESGHPGTGPAERAGAQAKLQSEVDADRFTRLDRMLSAEQREQGVIDLRPGEGATWLVRQNRALLIGRARNWSARAWPPRSSRDGGSCPPRAEPALRELGERGDIIKTMHRALAGKAWRRTAALANRPAWRGIRREASSAGCSTKALGGDEMGERVRLVIDGVDGRVHHIEMDPPAPRRWGGA